MELTRQETAIETVARVEYERTERETRAAAQWYTLQPEHDRKAMLRALPDPYFTRCFNYGLAVSWQLLPIQARDLIRKQYRERLCYDYTNQAWIRNGRYQDCSHPANTCGCYGRRHVGQLPAAEAEIH